MSAGKRYRTGEPEEPACSQESIVCQTCLSITALYAVPSKIKEVQPVPSRCYHLCRGANIVRCAIIASIASLGIEPRRVIAPLYRPNKTSGCLTDA